MTTYKLTGICDARLDYLLKKIKQSSTKVTCIDIHGERLQVDCISRSCERFLNCKERKTSAYHYNMTRYLRKGYAVTLLAV